ncbi:MAG TPA: DegV family protein [Solirubrobacteraceae bacterium]|jgi:DegV family protein with EDD domain|nr:DegV family protein [Solirubrobacteraceae bacterium]
MRPVAIVTDSTHYTTRELIEAAGVHEVSLYVRDGDEVRRETEISDYDGFYARLRSAAELPSTSQPSIGDFVAAYEPLLDAGCDIVSIHLAGGISGTVGAAAQAAALLGERRDDAARIEVIDAETACGGLGCVVLAAAAVARGGGGVEDVVARVREARATLAIWFCIDTLEYLQRGGRIGRAQAWLGGALKIKPILSLEAEITPVERVRTSGRAFERMLDYMRMRRDDGADGWVVQHIQSPERAAALVAKGRELFGCEPAWVSEVGPVIGTYTGPGLIGVGGIPARLFA